MIPRNRHFSKQLSKRIPIHGAEGSILQLFHYELCNRCHHSKDFRLYLFLELCQEHVFSLSFVFLHNWYCHTEIRRYNHHLNAKKYDFNPTIISIILQHFDMYFYLWYEIDVHLTYAFIYYQWLLLFNFYEHKYHNRSN